MLLWEGVRAGVVLVPFPLLTLQIGGSFKVPETGPEVLPGVNGCGFPAEVGVVEGLAVIEECPEIAGSWSTGALAVVSCDLGLEREC